MDHDIRLSDEQSQIVRHLEGSLLVVAGPGSGKTRVLTERLRRILLEVPGHFRVLALTFTNKAADEMRDRLNELGDERDRAFIGTLHSFCLELLTDRGMLVGVEAPINIFEQYKDRRDVLIRAIAEDPTLSEELDSAGDAKERNKRIDAWLAGVSHIKSHPITCAEIDDELSSRVYLAYESGMRACNAFDFDDLLLLAHRLLIERDGVAEIYRRLYQFICVDEAQDMNEAQYAVLRALCGTEHRNVMMVGDPRQSIFGFNESGPEYMERFASDFDARRYQLTANYRSSRAVVNAARLLDSNYMVAMQLPIEGDARIIEGLNEEDEAARVVSELGRLMREGHPDVEGMISASKCAVLGRTRFALLEIERALEAAGVPYYKRISANHENESELVEDFVLSLRLLANPRDRLHLSALGKRWGVPSPESHVGSVSLVSDLAAKSDELRAKTVAAAIGAISRTEPRVNLLSGFAALQSYADGLEEPERLAVYEDLAVLSSEWDQFLRMSAGAKSVASFLSHKALGSAQKNSKDGVGLLTVHSAKGLEFDVVFIAGMADGTFPDYRATTVKQLEEERRNAFVAVTRSRRLLYFSFPQNRVMPWGGTRRQVLSRFLRQRG